MSALLGTSAMMTIILLPVNLILLRSDIEWLRVAADSMTWVWLAWWLLIGGNILAKVARLSLGQGAILIFLTELLSTLASLHWVEGSKVHVHILGICGTLMGSIALLAKAQGHQVSGSDDQVYPPMSTQLEKASIPLQSPYSENSVPEGADLVVLGNAGLGRGNPAVEALLTQRIPYCSGAEFLGGMSFKISGSSRSVGLMAKPRQHQYSLGY